MSLSNNNLEVFYVLGSKNFQPHQGSLDLENFLYVAKKEK